jgi:competence protein ComEC
VTAPVADGSPQGAVPADGTGPVVDDERPDLRLLPAAAACWLTAFALLGRVTPDRCLFLSAAACAVGAAVLWRSRLRGRAESTGESDGADWWLQLGLILVCAGCTAAGVGLRLAALCVGPVPDLAARQSTAQVELVTTGDPRRREPTSAASPRPLVVVNARVEQVRSAGRLVRMRSPVVVMAATAEWSQLVPGSRLRTTGRFGPARVGEPVSAVLMVRGPPRPVAAPPLIQRVAERVRGGLREAVVDRPDPQRGLLPGLVLGDTSRMDPELTDDFRTAGLSHLCAVSGANLAILISFCLLAARWVGCRGVWLPLLGVLVTVLFVVLARPQPSVLRATVMGLVALLALVSGRRRRSGAALCAAVIVLVLFDPWLARSFGFTLSVLATAGILVLVPRWQKRLTRHLPEPLAAAVAVPLAAQVACAPVVVMLSGQISLVAVPANLLAALAVPPATVLGMGAALISPVAMPAAELLALPAGWSARWIAEVARVAAGLPGAAVAWPASLAGAGSLLVVMTAGVLLLRRRAAGGLAVVAVMAMFVLVGPRGVVPAALRHWPPVGWVLVACDVGQGDALVLRASADSAVLIDTGPDPQAMDRCLRELGIRRIPLVVLTHFHADHVGGLPGASRGRGIAEVQVSPLAEPSGQADRIRRWAAHRGVALTVGRPGEGRQVGDVTWRVLWPTRLIQGEGSAPNNASLVLLAVSAGVRMLLTGDIEPAAQAALRRAEPDLRADVFKIPHHGSACQDDALWRAVSPRLAVVSAGRGNDYGHPAAATLERARSSGSLVGRTDQHGDVAVVGPADRLRLVTRGVHDNAAVPPPPRPGALRQRPHRRGVTRCGHGLASLPPPSPRAPSGAIRHGSGPFPATGVSTRAVPPTSVELVAERPGRPGTRSRPVSSAEPGRADPNARAVVPYGRWGEPRRMPDSPAGIRGRGPPGRRRGRSPRRDVEC